MDVPFCIKTGKKVFSLITQVYRVSCFNKMKTLNLLIRGMIIMANIREVKEIRLSGELFVGQPYPDHERTSEFSAHIWQQWFESILSGLSQTQKLTTTSPVNFYDPQQRKYYIGLLFASDQPHREGFDNIKISAGKALKVVVTGEHTTGEFVSETIFDDIYQQAFKQVHPNDSIETAPFCEAYSIYDNVSFNPKSVESEITFIFRY